MAGAGLGGVLFPLMLRAGFTKLGYKWTIRLLAFVALALCVVATCLVKARLPKGRSKSTVNLRSLKDARFTWLTVGIFSKLDSVVSGSRIICLTCAGLELVVFASLGLYPTYVVLQGFSTNTSVLLLSVLNM
jgi:hypothetical protein